HLKTGEAGHEAMRAIKKALDPNSSMTPGKMLLVEEEAEVNELKQAEKERIQAAFKEKIDYDELVNCTRRGFCWPSCPTYVETGNDDAPAPGGRTALMAGGVDGVIEASDEVKESIDLCLGCRACETACPSGVNFGRLLEQARDAIYYDNEQTITVKMQRGTCINN